MTPDTDTPARAQDARAIDRAIAERLGWRDIEPVTYWEETYYDTYEVHTLRGKPPGYDHADNLLPHYSADLNAAMTLAEPYAIQLNSVHGNKGRIGYKVTIQDSEGQAGIGHADTPALAICYAWLRYMELWAHEAAAPRDAAGEG